MKLQYAPCLLLPLFLHACGGSTATPAASSQASTPVEAANAFFGAAQSGDRAAFEALLTEGARAGLAAGGGGFDLENGVDTFTVGTAEMDGDEARVPVYAELGGERQDLKLCLRQEDGLWRVWGFDVVIGTETAMTIDLESIGLMMEQVGNEMASAFEEAFEEAALGGSEEDIRLTRERFEAVAAISPEDHEDAWRIRFGASGQPASQILAALLSDTPFAIDDGEHAAALAEPVTLQLDGVSRIEAFERVCEAVDLTPVYPTFTGWDDEVAIAFTAGSRPSPVAFAGPFLIEVAELEENAPNTTGSITFAVHALGLAPGVIAYQTEMVQLLALDTIVAADGTNVNADDGMSFYGTPEIEGAFLSDRTSLDLMSLLSGVQAIDVTGKVMLTFPVEVQELRWIADETEPRLFNGLTCKRSEWAESIRFELSGLADFGGHNVRLSPRDAAGDPLGVLYSESSSWGDRLNFGTQAAETPASVDMKICRETELEYTFELAGVPLARWAEQPAELERLAFDGEAPLSAEFVRFTERGEFPKAELRVDNAANKDSLQAQATFVYLNAAGQELESFPHTLTGTYGFEGQEPLAAAGADGVLETVAFFMPQGTATIRVRIESVTFLDGTQWERP